MNNYIPADKLITEIERLGRNWDGVQELQPASLFQADLYELLAIITSLQQEQPEVDLEKLGEIARHIIAVKENVEDMRLNEDEWSLLERIGYPERFNARKEE